MIGDLAIRKSRFKQWRGDDRIQSFLTSS